MHNYKRFWCEASLSFNTNSISQSVIIAETYYVIWYWWCPVSAGTR